MKIHSSLKAIALAAAMIGCAATALAIPAKPGLRAWTQADGTVINVQVRGDEYHRIYLTDDEVMITLRDGNFYYAEAGADDRLHASAVRAEDSQTRSAQGRAFLQTVDQADLRQVAQNERIERLEAAQQAEQQARAVQGPQRKGPGLFSGTSFPSTGEQKALVILVAFADMPFTVENPHDYFTRMCNEPGFSDYYGTGCAREFYLASSMGQFDPGFDVYGPVTMPKGYAYYGAPSSNGGNDSHVPEMVIAACEMLDGEIDFSQYDRDNNGVIDNVYLFYAGQGEATCADENTIWPHASNVTGSHFFDGKRLSRYACSNEWEGNLASGRPDGPGTICHEFSHVMGLPDIYTTNYTTAFTPGDWDVMDNGCYNNNGFTPCLFNTQERYALGWIEPTVISGAMNATLLPLATSNEAFMIKTAKSNEYFLFENRQKIGWDRFLPGHGMLVWHIDFNQSLWDRNGVNNNASHQYVDIEEADNVKTDATRSGDPFPGSSKVTSFTDDTTPSMKAWSGAKLNLPITEITEHAPSGNITFKVAGGAALAPSTTANAATEVTPRSFKASWQAVAGAKSYRLSVYSTDAQGNRAYAPGYDMRNVGNVTAAAVTGLEPSTAYVYSVVVETETSSSNPSNEIGVNTAALTHEYVIPVALDATAIGDDTFTANWEAVDGADDYIIAAYSRKLNGAVTSVENFNGKIADWFLSSDEFYSSKNYSGELTPSAKLNDGDFVSTPISAGKIHSFTFWHRGNKAPDTARLSVEAYVSDCWAPVASFPVYNKQGGQKITVNTFPADATAARLIIYNSGANPVYVDDLVMVSGGQCVETPVDNYSNRLTGNVTSLAVPAAPGTEYFYTIKAVKAGVKSMPSNAIFLTTTGTVGIDAIAPDLDLDNAIYYNLQGIPVANPVPGEVYIVVSGDKALKVIK